MKDLIRTYRMIIKRKDESDGESQPLLSSSCSSTESFGAVEDRFVFNHEAETTDTEIDQYKTYINTNTLAPTMVQPLYQKPLIISNQFDRPPLETYVRSDSVYDSYNYYNKCSGILNDDLPVKPKLIAMNWRSYSHEEPVRTNSSLVTIFAIWNTIMGTSLLAMSWGIEKAGLFPGLFLILIMGGICLYTANVIVNVSKNQGDGLEVPDLCKMFYGTWLEYIAKFFSLVVLMGACIVYWVLMTNFLYNTVNFIHDFFNNNHTSLSSNITVICPKDIKLNLTNATTPRSPGDIVFENVWNLYNTVPIILAFAMFPILNFKSPTFFTKFNSLGAISVMFIIVFVAIKSFSWGINIKDWAMEFNLKNNFYALSGMLSLSYFIHNIIISIVKNNKRQEKNGRDLTIAYFLVTFTYVFVGVAFYVCFPLAKSCIEDNFLNNFAKKDTLTVIARALLLFQLLTVFPLMAFMLRRDILVNLSHLFKNPGFERYASGRVIFLNMIVATICILFACFMPRIGTLIRFTGAFSGVVYIFTLPSLLKIAMLKKEGNLTISSLILHASIIFVGILNLISQFFVEEV